jgi:hypothetical protein
VNWAGYSNHLIVSENCNLPITKLTFTYLEKKLEKRCRMLTEGLINEKLGDLEQEYVGYLIEHFAEWEVWAKTSQRVADGEEVKEEEVPEAFRTELKITRVIVEMMDLGKFDWNHPKVRGIFSELSKAPFYSLFGKMITKISLRLAALAGVKTLLEIGAGKANLTGIMLKQMAQSDIALQLIVTDSHEVVLENMEKLRAEYPGMKLETRLWDITGPPPDDLIDKVESPSLMYERYTLNYANLDSIRNVAKIADIVVLGDWINYTGQLFAYDEVFKKIGSKPIFYRDIKPVLDDCFPNQLIFDKRALDTLGLPTISMLICWK